MSKEEDDWCYYSGMPSPNAYNKTNISKEEIYTGVIPQCPYCEKPTKRTQGMSMSTAMYFPPMYDENNVNTNPDRNTITTEYVCQECNKGYSVKGNHTDGFTY